MCDPPILFEGLSVIDARCFRHEKAEPTPAEQAEVPGPHVIPHEDV